MLWSACRTAQHVCDASLLLARPGALPRLGEAPTNFPNRQAIAADPGQDLADHLGFVRDQLIACLSPAGLLRHIAIAIGRTAEHIDDASARHGVCHADGVR